MSEILIPKCTKNLSSTANLLIWLFVFFWVGKLFQYLLDIRRLHHMHDFYRYLLEIPDTDIQTVSWQEIVKRLMALRDMTLRLPLALANDIGDLQAANRDNVWTLMTSQTV